MDMSPAFIKGAKDNFPKAAITFDKFHVIKAVNEAVEEVRRTESKEQKETLGKLKDCELDTAKAYRMRLILQEIFRYPAAIAPAVMKDWISWGCIAA
jgi:transposase